MREIKKVKNKIHAFDPPGASLSISSNKHKVNPVRFDFFPSKLGKTAVMSSGYWMRSIEKYGNIKITLRNVATATFAAQ